MAVALQEALGTGRRKTAVARVRVKAGSGQIQINGRDIGDYFPLDVERESALAPLKHTGKFGKVDIRVTVEGGGPRSQADAVKLGVARALKTFDPEVEPALREHHLLTRDSRMKERKKYGLRGARRGTQFSKR